MRHPLHSICPYFAMFPEGFVADQLMAYTKQGDVVFDPFCGRGTTILESLLQGRNAAGVDVNPVAACIAGAKADPPELSLALARLQQLEEKYRTEKHLDTIADEFFNACFHSETLAQILFLRNELRWQESQVDRFIAAVVLGCLHGESHRSPNYLSNRMPRTISTKPAYSVRWWAARGLEPPHRDAFRIVARLINYRLSKPSAALKGKVALKDARKAALAFPELAGSVDLIVTSPPYLDTTNFREDQWLRLWFLGGLPRPNLGPIGDDRYRTEEPYWTFLVEAWRGCANLLKVGSVIVIRIGGARLSLERLSAGLMDTLTQGMEGFNIAPLQKGVATEIVNRQTNAFRPGTTSKRFEHDFVFRLADG